MRQTSGSVVCPSCGRLVEVNEARCPFCGYMRPGMFGYARFLRERLGDLDMTALIVAFCVVVYVLSLVVDPRALLQPRGVFSILGPSGRANLLLGMTGRLGLGEPHPGLLLQLREYTSLISAIFLHGGLLHIFFNIMWIRQLGPFVEENFGTTRAFLIFVLSGVGGFVLSNVVSGAATVGASGSIFGLLGATVAFGRRRGGSFGQAVSQQALMWAGMVFVMGFLMSGVNNWAHGGGFVSGWGLAALLVPRGGRPESPWLQVAALALAVACAASIVVSVLAVFPLIYG